MCDWLLGCVVTYADQVDRGLMQPEVTGNHMTEPEVTSPEVTWLKPEVTCFRMGNR